MEKQVQVMLPQHLFDKLHKVAEQRQTDILHLLDQVMENYLAQDSLAQIEVEQRAYEAQHAELSTRYTGEYIAMHRGQVIDHDSDRVALSRRVRASYGNAPILITPVLAEARQTIRVRSPHLREGVE